MPARLRRSRRATSDPPRPAAAGDDRSISPERGPAAAGDRLALERARPRPRRARRRPDAAREPAPRSSASTSRAVAVVSEDGKHAPGCWPSPRAATPTGGRGRLDFEQEPSGIASAAFEGGPVVVYDAAGSPRVNRRLAEKVGAKSAVFVPLVADEKVFAVLVHRDDHGSGGSSPARSSRCSRRSRPRPRLRSSAPARRARSPRRSSGSGSSRRSDARLRSELDLEAVASGRRRGDRQGAGRHALLPAARRAGRADADSRRVGRRGLRPDRRRGRSAPGHESRGTRAANCGRQRRPRRARAGRPELGGIQGMLDLGRRWRCSRLRSSSSTGWSASSGCTGPSRALARGRDLAGRGCVPRGRDRVSHGAAARGEQAAARAADGTAHAAQVVTSELRARDGAPAARRRGDQAARRRRGRLLPLRRASARCCAAQPSTGSIAELVGFEFPTESRDRPDAVRPSPSEHPGLRGLRQRDRRSDDLGGRDAGACSASRTRDPDRRVRRRSSRTCSRRSRGLASLARSERRELRAERAPGARAARVLRDRFGARASRSRRPRLSTPSRTRRTRRSAGRSRRS